MAVATALENLGFTTEIIEVRLDLESIESLPTRRPRLVFNLVDAIDGDPQLQPTGHYAKTPEILIRPL